jgi:hypothetical protein
LPIDRCALVNKYNSERSSSLGVLFLEYAKQQCDRVYMYQLDSLGFDLLGRIGDSDSAELSWHRVRLDFPEPMTTPEKADEAIQNAIEIALESAQTNNSNTNNTRQ